MKKLIALLFLFPGFGAFAQYGDTLGVTPGTFPEFAPNNQATLLPYIFYGGYIYGVNGDPNNFNAIAQGYELDTPSEVAGVLSFVAVKEKGPLNQPSTLTFEIYNMTATGALNITSPNPFETEPAEGPAGTALGSTQIFFEEIDTTTLTYTWAPFANPVFVQGNFAVAANLASLRAAGDTIAFLSDGIGSANGRNFAFHRANNGFANVWYTSNSLFGGALNNNIAIFPVLSGTSGVARVNGFEINVFPNPSADFITIEANSFKNSELKLILLDSQGRETGIHSTLNSTEKNSEQLDIRALPEGNYFLLLSGSDGTRIARKITKLRN
jgi:hypothetical protein